MFWKIGLLVVLTSFLFLNCQGKVNAELMDTAADEEAIKELVKEVIVTFQSKDFDSYKNLWVHESYVMRMGSDGTKLIGWDSLGVWYKNYMEQNPNVSNNLNVEIPEIHVKVYDDAAWAYNIHKITWKDTEGKRREAEKWNVRFLEKVDGTWRISCYVDG
jgi:ketosteroid isomerase-like protein